MAITYGGLDLHFPVSLVLLASISFSVWTSQKKWDTTKSSMTADRLVYLLDHYCLICFCSVSEPHSSAGSTQCYHLQMALTLIATPCTLGVSLELGLQICEPPECCCGSIIYSFGLHSTGCFKIIKHSLDVTGFSSQQNSTGLNQGDGRRPKVLQFSCGGRPLIWDVTRIISRSNLLLSVTSPGSTAFQAENKKNKTEHFPVL